MAILSVIEISDPEKQQKQLNNLLGELSPEWGVDDCNIDTAREGSRWFGLYDDDEELQGVSVAEPIIDSAWEVHIAVRQPHRGRSAYQFAREALGIFFNREPAAVAVIPSLTRQVRQFAAALGAKNLIHPMMWLDRETFRNQ